MPYALIQRRSARSARRGSSRSACYRPRSGDERLPPGNQWSPPAARLCAVNVTELAPSTRYGDCRAQHTFVFFIGQALGPVVYGFDLRSAGITPALLAGALVLSIVPSLDERSLVAPTVGRDALVRHPDVLRQPSRMPKHVYRYAAARVPVTANTKPFRLDQFE
jgi:hypothetical protein